nr:LOW QUALITY PROTEIN: titin-like [Maniola hyperantus]
MAKKKNTKKTNEKKAPAKPASLPDTINTEALIAARSFTNLPVLLKVCRLCEAKDGPFLNIFDADKVTAKKIEIVMPFGIAENDDLPHKICFRCSAKVEELYEFIQKCVKTQENLRQAMGNRKTGAKTKHRELWEEKLNQSNISNDDICDAVIKRAMEGIKDIPLNPLPLIEEKAPIAKKATKKIDIKKKEEEKAKSKKNEVFTPNDDEPIISLKKARNNDVDEDEPPVKRITRLSNEKKVEVNENKPTKSVDTKEISKPTKKIKPDLKTIVERIPKDIGLKIKQSLQTNNISLEAAPQRQEPPKSEPEPKPFDIMESVSMIKVNGVGVLFQCKLCNRNFLKKEVVMSHACAKQGAMKILAPKSDVPPEPPKLPQTVKYITMNVNKEVSKPGVSDDKAKTVEIKQPVTVSEPITLDDDDDDAMPLTVKKPVKPKIGPASKVRRTDTNVTPVASESSVKGNANQQMAATTPSNPIPIVPNITATITSASQASVQFPTIPSLNSRYKLMPGPNNTFTLVEDKTVETVAKPVDPPVNTVPFSSTNTTDSRMHNSTVRPIENSLHIANNLPKQTDPSASRPYPVGLIKSVSGAGSRTPLVPEPPLAFPTPAMKKQSYTVVQTGNPSKLLISTKPQPPPPIEEEVPKKRSRKSRNLAKTSEPQKQPFSVTIEDAAPPPADPGFFTFINVDPLLQPSYVLPTDNIIQESQISTSTNVTKQAEDKDTKYTCNMCNEKFSREKKLLAHIQSHYEKMDAEDQKRTEKTKKRSRK